MAGAVIDALRRFLPVHARTHALDEAKRRAVWPINHCRTAEMGGHLHACSACGKKEFRFHSCNHRSCPQCGKQATADWVERELGKRVGAPYFMVTFTLPEDLRKLFFTPQAKEVYQLFFAAASSALSDALANPRWLGASTSGFTMVLHTWNQRLHFHPHLHCIVPGAGIGANGRVVTVIRYHGFCHPAAKAKRERIAFHTGRPLLLGPPAVKAPKPPATCPCCGEPMIRLLTLLPAWRSTPNRAPPHKLRSCA